MKITDLKTYFMIVELESGHIKFAINEGDPMSDICEIEIDKESLRAIYKSRGKGIGAAIAIKGRSMFMEPDTYAIGNAYGYCVTGDLPYTVSLCLVVGNLQIPNKGRDGIIECNSIYNFTIDETTVHKVID